ncbi:MAG: restriction endonuclease subunit S [Verrucomicrobiota bacterium JB022]|nr:restriction endonuclease subunit S [Verrucomicrobiota bacterium JB022]
MNPEVFLKNFGHVVNAPGGSVKLRDMVYFLAITGRLSQQVLEDGTGEDLLKEIEAEKKWRIENKSFKRSPKLEKCNALYAENLPEIPASWCWSRLVDLGEISPKNEADYTQEASFLPMASISERHGADVIPENRTWGQIAKGYTHFKNQDVVVAKITPCFENGKAAVIRGLPSRIGAGTTELHVVRLLPRIEPSFVYIFLKSPYFRTFGESKMTGTAGQKRLPTEYFATRPFPLPPLAEQKRIVAKVDALMALCDRLEAQQQKRTELRPKLVVATHIRFTETPTPESLRACFAEPGHANPKELRKTILSLAVQGKLVEQDGREGTGAQLLGEIAKVRKELLESGYPNSNESEVQARKQKKQMLPQALPTLPGGWSWATLMQCCLIVVDCHNKTAPYTKEGIILLRTTNIRNGELNDKERKYISKETYLKWAARCPPEPGDILITREAPMGEACIIPEGMKVCMGQRMMLARVVPNTILRTYLLICLTAPDMMDRVQDKPIGALVEHLRVGGVETMLIPVPPLAEQRRIVAKVDELMALVDKLEQQQSRREALAAAYAQSAVSALTGTEFKPKAEKMKAPKTELISMVCLRANPDDKEAAPLASLLATNNDKLEAKTLWQRSGLAIEDFYQQLKKEIAAGYIQQPEEASFRELEESKTGANRNRIH